MCGGLFAIDQQIVGGPSRAAGHVFGKRLLVNRYE